MKHLQEGPQVALRDISCSQITMYTFILQKHGRGGQSALRFARLRMEKRHNYVRKVST